ncbi:MAG: hypothetical protein HZC36_13855 [Armatimonadetes bacterium]|nr:hypothetical protein [Armatimonadota bacterium]
MFQPTGIQLHLITGRKHMFYQDKPELVAAICNDLDGQIFARSSLILDSADDVTAFPGQALIGITIMTDPLPEFFFERERSAKTIITQISQETFQYRRLQIISKVEGRMGVILSELEFASGERLFLEGTAIAASGMSERSALSHLFAGPSLWCRRLEGGFSIWNTAHIVSWSHYPKLEAPANAWPAESLPEHVLSDARVVSML